VLKMQEGPHIVPVIWATYLLVERRKYVSQVQAIMWIDERRT